MFQFLNFVGKMGIGEEVIGEEEKNEL